MKLCLVKTSSMGDIIHTLPALTDAQQAIPDLQVDWVVEENFAEIPRWHQAVKQVIPIALRRWRHSPFSRQTRNEWNNYRTLVQQNQYDAIIDAQGLVKSALFATALAKATAQSIKKGAKHGYDFHSVREPLAAFFYNQRHHIATKQHAVERIRQLFAQSLNYPIPSQRGDYHIAGNFLPQSRQTHPYILFIHGTTRTDKHWCITQWRALAEKLTALGFEIHLPWGNLQEQKTAEHIAQGINRTLVLPKLSLSELAHQIANSAAVISVDTGLAHLTAALDKTNISLYGATDPQRIGTYGKNQYHIQATNMQAICHEQVLTQFQLVSNFSL